MATNIIMRDASEISVVVSHPTTPASGDPVRFGSYATGVALTDERTDGTTTVLFGDFVADLSVKGVNDSGNSAVAVGDAIYYTDGDTPRLNKKATGVFFGFALETVGSGSTATIKVKHMPSPGSGSLGSGTVGATQLATDSVTAVKLAGNLGIGHIPLDITTVRIISTNAIQNTTEGGVPDGNTDPSLARVNGATDKALRLVWAAASVVEVQFAPVAKPADMDGAAAVEVHLLIAKDTNTDNTAVVAVNIFDGVGDTNAGGNTAALSTASLTEYSVSLAAGDLGDPPGFLNISLIPGTHANDAIRLYAAWIEYTRKD